MITGLLNAVLSLYQLLLIAYVVISLLKIPANRWTELLRSVVEPVLGHVRRLVNKYLPERFQVFDWSPVVLFLVIELVKILL